MKAAVVRTFGQPLTIEELPLREPKENEIVVKTIASGVCHSDVHTANGEWPLKPKMPLVMGHEGLGYVAATGPNVKNVKEGDIVGVPWLYNACGHCEFCTSGWEPLCMTQENSGYTLDGGHAEYIVADARYVARFPEKKFDPYEMAPILCAGVTVYKGLKMADVQPGEWIAISGIGGLGHLAVQYAKVMGYNVAAIDVTDEKLDLAKRVGADITINSSKQDAAAFLQKELGGVHGMAVTAVAVPAFDHAIGAVRRGSTVSVIGIPVGNMSFSIFDIVLNAITVRGSVIGTRQEMQEAIDFAVEGKVKTTIHKAKMEDINEILDKLKHGKIEGRMVLNISDPV